MLLFKKHIAYGKDRDEGCESFYEEVPVTYRAEVFAIMAMELYPRLNPDYLKAVMSTLVDQLDQVEQQGIANSDLTLTLKAKPLPIVGYEMRCWRKNAGMSRVRLAEKLGCSASKIARMEAGTTYITRSEVLFMIQIFDIRDQTYIGKLLVSIAIKR